MWDEEVERVALNTNQGEDRDMVQSRIATVLTAAVLVTMVCGCAALWGPSDEELINGTIDEMKAAMEAQNVDRIMAVYSEDFEGEQGGKPELRQMIEYVIDEGYMDSIEINTEDAETTVEGDVATYGPVELSGDFGAMSFEYTLKKEADGVWRIVGSEPQR